METSVNAVDKLEFFDGEPYVMPTVSNISPEEFVIPAILLAAVVSGAVGGAVGAVVSKLMS